MMEIEIIWGEIKIRILPKIARLKIARSKASYSTRPVIARSKEIFILRLLNGK